MEYAEITVRGTVQGVGFRPFLVRTAKELSVCGTAANTPFGVAVRACGEKNSIEEFCRIISFSPPPLARVKSVEKTDCPPFEAEGFVILPSIAGGADTFVLPDMGICDNCRKDITDPGNRRFGYAFTNCTDCGPRFSIIASVPYDRAGTTMKSFEMCDDCRAEYTDPFNRRYHAQPVACAVCGPRVRFEEKNGSCGGDPFLKLDEALKAGKIAAIKGLGGYHLACDAFNEKAVNALRERKGRHGKAFAVMARDIETVKKYCIVDWCEERLLQSPEKPIVLLKKREPSPLAPGVAPGRHELGVMLPYTPLHCLVMRGFELLVMTSGNVSDLPMVFEDDGGRYLLSGLADCLLDHDRGIYRRVDDSVCRVINSSPRFIRRARGFAPEPITLVNKSGRDILAFGSQQKNTFCLVKGENAFLSSHIGDLDDEKTGESYEREIASFLKLFNGSPETAVCDLHPDYYSARLAEKSGLRLVKIQHHAAHFASVLAENGESGETLGFVFDGTGLGDDGTVWGGEAFFGSVGKCKRVGSLLQFPLPGNERAVREPWRTAAMLIDIACPEAGFGVLGEYAEKCPITVKAARAGINSALTSSMGRLFDAVSAITGICREAEYEGQGAEMLEQAIDESFEGEYHFDMTENGGFFRFDWKNVIRSAVEDTENGVPAGGVAVRFHRAVVTLITEFAEMFRKKTGCGKAALSGGCFVNAFLSGNAERELEKNGFEVLINRLVPCNDGGISFGEAAAAAMIEKE